MKSIWLAITVMLFVCGCEWFGPAEKSKTEAARTTYRSAEENAGNPDEVRPIQQKVPGESTKH